MNASGFEFTGSLNEIDHEIEQAQERLHEAIIEVLNYVGLECVKHVKTLPQMSVADKDRGKLPPHQPHFIDWTSNLRSSVGYNIVYNGRIFREGGFEAIKGGNEGAQTGKEYIAKIAQEIGEGYALIVVAGMKYAAYVSAKGYDVLDSAEQLSERLLNELLSKLAQSL